MFVTQPSCQHYSNLMTLASKKEIYNDDLHGGANDQSLLNFYFQSGSFEQNDHQSNIKWMGIPEEFNGMHVQQFDDIKKKSLKTIHGKVWNEVPEISQMFWEKSNEIKRFQNELKSGTDWIQI